VDGQHLGRFHALLAPQRLPALARAPLLPPELGRGRRGERPRLAHPATMSGGRRGERRRERSAAQQASEDEEVNAQDPARIASRSEDSEMNTRVNGGAHPSCHAPTSGPPALPGFRSCLHRAGSPLLRRLVGNWTLGSLTRRRDERGSDRRTPPVSPEGRRSRAPPESEASKSVAVQPSRPGLSPSAWRRSDVDELRRSTG
jgi:hypothetical protein